VQEGTINTTLPGTRRKKPLQHALPSKSPGMLLMEVSNLQTPRDGGWCNGGRDWELCS